MLKNTNALIPRAVLKEFFSPSRTLALAFLALACFVMTDLTYAQGKMPKIQTESLDRVPFNLPQDLPADPCIVMIGFEFDHQVRLDNWLDKMKLRADNKEWIQVHLISRNFSLISGFINSRKRPYFTDPFLRARVVPIYTNIPDFLGALDLPMSQKDPYVLVIDRNGEVKHFEQGDYTPQKAEKLQRALSGSN
jgi:hypothetical protein